MEEIAQARTEDATSLADLYAKAFESTGFKEFALPEKRGELIVWLEGLCGAGKLWFSRDDAGVVSLGHYEPDKDEVVTIATRDGMEGNGHATTMLRKLASIYPTSKVRPVTRGGKAVAERCGFSPSPNDESLWVRIVRS
ncbi:hypothetical protein [uncultured Paracoccus sp.]|uniref:hypothetical protein n=1 Tax=uncultured Paracoccus sp. TaxID=189685 RepID=UPI002610CE4B|nr:hypothetical protein [uncultured Paracoccus sp.]